jgi:putative spermidine/putrescine transport system permease protein
MTVGRFASTALWVFVVLFLALPIVIVALLSFSAASYLTFPPPVTLPRRIWDDLRYAIDPTIAAVSTLTIVLTAVLLGGAHVLRRRSASSAR